MTIVVTPVAPAQVTVQEGSPLSVVVRAPATRQVVRVMDKGPKGDSAGYTHNQGTPAATWTIAHNLGFYPSVSLYSAGGVTMFGTVVNLSLNVLQVSFEVPVAGTARLA